MLSDNFYKDLRSFSEFAAIGDLTAYTSAPADWVVLAADIVRSYDAVRAGRYKDVNLIGAAVISSVLNVLGRERIPFVFGGDGAMLMVSKSDLRAGSLALAGVARLAKQEVDLELRIAAIPMSELRARGADVRLRKFALSPGNYLAMAVGDGLELAERILKDPGQCEPFAIAIDDAVTPTLEGLSCRWEPIPARKGHMVSLIVKPASSGGSSELAAVLNGIQDAIGFDPLSDNPEDALAHRDNLRFRFPPTSFGLEVRLVGAATGRVRYALRSLVENLAFVWGYFTGLRVGPFRPKRYLAELSRNTDHRKLDDSLRLVLDVSDKGVERLKAYLQGAYQKRQLVYGLHDAPSALMTCFVADIADSRHIHFIDGADGGLSMAGADFKARLHERDGGAF